jgi:outer membrane protein OmpA-like peptidoglycan-associated protein
MNEMKNFTSNVRWMHAILLAFLFMAFTISADAQTADKRWNLGFHGGIGQYYGDLGHSFYQFDTPWYGFGGLSFTRYLGNRVDLNLFLTKGEIGFSNGTEHFRNQITTGTLNFRFNVLGAESMVRPYIFAGAGVLMFTDFFTTKKDEIDFVAPSFGGGVNIRLTPAVMLNLQETFLYSTEDKRDGVIKKSNDLFLFHSVGLTFNFGKKQDADGDGVADRKDKCSNTPPGVKVDEFGCPYDTDMDGVPDHLDKCPNTPANVKVDAKGCPLDSDNDGVPDYLDKCPNTLAKVMVDAQGCPLDSDNDGVADYLDKCPNTPANVSVDSDGCPLDADNDGVPDYLDKCPNTPKGATVDEFGCTLDTDKDGVPDYLDKCPTIPGTIENHGCPALTKEVEILFKKALQGIKFDTGKSSIKSVSFPILDAVVKVMKENPSYKLIIGGHTDNVGGEGMNMTLSKDRADAVANYLIGKGVSPTRISSAGYGYSIPVDDNTTVAGRTRNRRVELSVEFIEVIEVEK